MNSLFKPLAAFLLAMCIAACAAAPAAGAPKYSIDSTPLEALEAAPAAQATVRKHLPTIFEHPAYAMFKAMTLKDLLPLSQGALTEERLKALQADLDQLK